MANFSDDLNTFREIERSIREKAVDGYLLFVDLVGSTAYKVENGEAAWLSRLLAFYGLVDRALQPIKIAKYLGDGVLAFVPAATTSAPDMAQAAQRILTAVEHQNESYRGAHKISLRIVLGVGPAYMFNGDDPQGSCVDKIFRMEKYVPTGCIGLTDEFRNRLSGVEVVEIGQVSLRGLSSGRHPLYVLGNEAACPQVPLEQARRDASLRDIWDLGAGSGGPIFLVSGYIPADSSGQQTIQLGDKDAVILALQNLARIGRVDDTQVLSSRDIKESNLRENVVCVGGPFWNSVTRRFMRDVKSPYVFDLSSAEDNTPLVEVKDGRRYNTARDQGRITVDYGFFARFTNPLNPERHVILACGIETQAVAGVMEAFSQEQADFVSLHKALPRREISDGRTNLADYFCLMRFEVEDTGRVRLPSRDDQVANIVTNWPRHATVPLQESTPELST